MIQFLFAPGLALVGLELLPGSPTADTFKCIKDAGYQFVVIRAYKMNGTPQPNANQYLTWAKEAGLQTDIEMYSCRSKNATSQVDDLLSKVDKSLYDRLWVEIEKNPGFDNCQWYHYDADSNCQYAVQLITRANSSGKRVGVYSSGFAWATLFSSKASCSYFTNYPLWYTSSDNNPALTNFTPFAGWTRPTMKTFAVDVQICNINANRSFRS